jgi:hypothetical protein
MYSKLLKFWQVIGLKPMVSKKKLEYEQFLEKLAFILPNQSGAQPYQSFTFTAQRLQTVQR